MALSSPGLINSACLTLQSPTSLRNCLGRLVVTTGYIVILTFIGCLFPFFGDFLALVS